MPRKSKVDGEVEDMTIWTPETTHALLVVLDEFVNTNNWAHPVLKDFKAMSSKLLGVCYKRYSGSQIKTKYHRMRVIYGKWKTMINHTGFGWDFDNNTPVCKKDVWEDYYKANPGANKFKYVGLPNYDMNKNVFDKANVTGGLGYSSSQLPCDIEEEQDIEDRFVHPDGRPSDVDEKAFQDYIGEQRSGDKRAGPSNGRGRGRKKG